MTRWDTYGTDIGPQCEACNGTVYRYSVWYAEGREECDGAECVACGRETGFWYRLQPGDTVRELRAFHVRARLVQQAHAMGVRHA